VEQEAADEFVGTVDKVTSRLWAENFLPWTAQQKKPIALNE
jgi:hypothetical protein